MQVIKRNGDFVEFNKQKIINAINGAFIEVDEMLYETDTAQEIANDIEKYAEHRANNPMTVEAIQDMIEELLMVSERKDVARAYVRFRYKKEVAREQKNTFFDAIGKKLRGIGIENSNANMDENSFSGRIGTASNVMLKQYALDYCLSDLSRKNHLENMIYIHDLDHYPTGDHNCLSVPFDHLLANGFKVRQTDVRPANSINTAFQLIAVIFQLQSLEQFGGVSATHLDWTMVPYVRKSFRKHYIDGLTYLDWEVREHPDHCANSFFDIITENMGIEDEYFRAIENVYNYAIDKTTKEVYQATEGLFHNLNTLQSRSGGQLKRMAG